MKILTPFIQRVVSGHYDGRIVDFLRDLKQERIEAQGADTSTARFFDEINDNERFDVPERLAVGPSFFTSDEMLRYNDRADWSQVDLYMQIFAARFIEAARKHKIPLYVHTALRSPQEQDRLKAAGRSQLTSRNAPHCKGAAVDIVHARYHWQLTPHEWLLLGKIGKKVASSITVRDPANGNKAVGPLALDWGGDWKPKGSKDLIGWDPAHWQLSNWQSKLVAVPAVPVRLTPRAILARYRGL